MTTHKVNQLFPNGNIMSEYYYLDDRYHHEGDKPAIIEYYPSGIVWVEKYCLNGKNHREGDKPAKIVYYKNGNIMHEEYHLNDRYCRESGKPHAIKYSENGMTETHCWYNEKFKEIKSETHDISLELTKACRD